MYETVHDYVKKIVPRIIMQTTTTALDIVISHWVASPSHEMTRTIASIASAVSRHSLPSIHHCRKKLSALRDESRDLCTENFVEGKELERCIDAASRGIPLTYAVLRHAVSNGHVTLVRMALDGGVGVDGHSQSTVFTPLVLACSAGNEEIVRMLLDAGANVNRKSCYGWTPLICAKTSRITELLLSAGADPNLADDLERTPLLLAVEDDDIEKLRVCLNSSGIDVNCRDLEGETPLMLAARRGLLEIVKELLLSGADPNAMDKNGSSPLLAGIRHPTIVYILLQAGADARVRDSLGRTPFLKAVDLEISKTVHILARHFLEDRGD